MPLTKPVLDIEPDIPIVLRKVCKKDLNELRKFKFYAWQPDFLELLRRGGVAFIAISNEKIVGYACAGYRDSDLGGLVKLRKDDALRFIELVLPEYRGKRIGPSLMVAVARHLKEQGYKRLMGSAELSNYSARKAYMRAGYVEHTIVSHFRMTKYVFYNSIRYKICKACRT